MKSARRRSREFVLQGLYASQLAGEPVADLVAQMESAKGFERADREYFAMLLGGAIENRLALEQAIAPCLDRPVAQVSPVERGILLLAAFELLHCPGVPYRVVINEAVELAKSYGGTDGHRYVNGVLDKLARSLRPQEARAAV